MSGMINELIDVLREQAICYDYLLGLAEEKKDIIINNNVSELQKVNILETNIINQHSALEKKQISLVKDISNVLAIDDENVTITTIAKKIEGKSFHKELLDLIDDIKNKIEKLRKANELNKSLIASSMEFIEYTVNAISSSIDKDSGVIDAMGRDVNHGQTFFDAKQ